MVFVGVRYYIIAVVYPVEILVLPIPGGRDMTVVLFHIKFLSRVSAFFLLLSRLLLALTLEA